jgi:uncharacterized protein (TIGR03437 family)
VTVFVTAASNLTVSPGSVNVRYLQGGQLPATQTISVGATGGVQSFSAAAETASGGNWLQLNSSTGSTPANLTVSFNPAGLGPGAYSGVVRISYQDPNKPPLSVPVSMTVMQPQPAITAVVSAASFLPGAVAPGELVTIFGSFLGPDELVKLRLTASDQVDTNLADTQVYFDGIAAPLVYVTSGQISAIVPYAIAGRTSVRIEVERNLIRSAVTDVPVQALVPEIFTADASGQAAAVNEDGTVNTAENGIEPGKIIILYATGEGVVSPGQPDGKVIRDELSRPMEPVSVQINGQEAEVLYAGSAPMMPSGVMQLNVRTPADLARGSRPTVVLKVGSVSSRGPASITIRP